MTGQDLKNSILQLAIQGKLVEQREEEVTAKDLIEEIKSEKERLVKEKKIKKQKPLPEIREEEIPFDIPESWEWVKLGDLVDFNIGKTPQRSNDKFWGNDYNWISIADMIPNGYVNETKEKITELALEDRFKNKLVPKGTLLMSFKLTIGRVSILNIPAVHNEAIISIYPYGDKNNIIRDYYFTILPLISSYGDTKGAIKGKTLNSTSLNNLLIPLPPIAEQKRIVEKIKELMPYVDNYGETHIKLEELNKNFPDDMQKSILQYAIQGKLVGQREEEESAEELYKKIQEEKEKLIKEGKIKRTKALAEITEDEIPFDIPESWKWVRLGEIFNVNMGQSPKGNSVSENEDGIEFHQGKVFFGNDYIQKSNQYTNSPTKIAEPGTVLLCVRAPVGIVNITERTICIGRGLCGINTFSGMDPKFAMYILRGFETTFIKKATGTTFIAITSKVVNDQPFPLPPLEEQKRIVSKIEELFPLCKQLEK